MDLPDLSRFDLETSAAIIAGTVCFVSGVLYALLSEARDMRRRMVLRKMVQAERNRSSW